MVDDYLVRLNIFLGSNPLITQSAELTAFDGVEYKVFLRRSIAAESWFHVCFERQGSVLRAYVNGVYCGASSGSLGTNNINPTSAKFIRPERMSLISELFIDEIRISKTARYGTGNNNFTPPSAPFGKITGGKLGFKPALSGKNNRISITEAVP